MATVTVTVTTNWSQAGAAGEVKYNMQNQSQKIVEYATAATTPAVGDTGVRLSPGGTHPVDVPTGTNLYVRCKDADAATVVKLADVV